MMRIPQETVDCIKKYYLDESNCHILPGQRDFVSVKDSSGKKIKLQKRLLTQTVHDLWLNFKDDYREKLEVLPRFSFFARLRPVQCIVAGDPGSHNICVCAQHENIKLKVNAWNKHLNYRDLLEASVCSTSNIRCMLHDCIKCPGVEKIQEFANQRNTFTQQTISYKTWVEDGTKASLTTVEEPIEIFKKQLFAELWDLTIHHFIADEQKQFLKTSKENLTSDTCILVIDFSENYSFIIQNSVQAFFYNNKQATIHPVTMYYKEPGSDELLNVNFCIISDTKDHFSYTVHAFMEKVTDVLKKEYSWIKNIIYFSDGAPTQYKNK